MSVLLTGATGAVGRPLVDALLARGVPVRALTRDPGAARLPTAVETLRADLADASTIRPGAFDGVEAVFVFPAGDTAGLVDAAIAAGVRRFTVLSSLASALEHPRDVGSASQVHHTAVERAVTQRTDRWTVLRPGTFADNLLGWAWPISRGLPVRAPFLRSAQAPIHAADVGEAAAAALLDDRWTGRAIALSGPESLTRAEQAETIAAAIGRPVPVEEVDADAFRRETAGMIPSPIVEMLLAYWRDTVAEPDPVRPGLLELTGRPGRPLRTWAEEHRAAFLPPPA